MQCYILTEGYLKGIKSNFRISIYYGDDCCNTDDSAKIKREFRHIAFDATWLSSRNICKECLAEVYSSRIYLVLDRELKILQLITSCEVSPSLLWYLSWMKRLRWRPAKFHCQYITAITCETVIVRRAIPLSVLQEWICMVQIWLDIRAGFKSMFIWNRRPI